MAYSSNSLPSRFPVGTKFVIEGRRGGEGKMQVFSRFIEFPDGTMLPLPKRPGRKSDPAAGRRAARACRAIERSVRVERMSHKKLGGTRLPIPTANAQTAIAQKKGARRPLGDSRCPGLLSPSTHAAACRPDGVQVCAGPGQPRRFSPRLKTPHRRAICQIVTWPNGRARNNRMRHAASGFLLALTCAYAQA